MKIECTFLRYKTIYNVKMFGDKNFIFFTASSSKIKRKNMQQELENNFFHNQPDHLKQIVDFISERISNNFVRILKEDLIQSGLKTVIDVIATNLKVYEG